MTKGSRTIVALLAAVAVLLGLNLIVRGSTPAAAQVAAGPVRPTVIGMEAVQTQTSVGGSNQWRVFRLFDDGTVDMKMVEFQDFGGCLLNSQCGPVTVVPGPCPEDVNNDRAVNVLDLIDLLLAFGTACP